VAMTAGAVVVSATPTAALAAMLVAVAASAAALAGSVTATCCGAAPWEILQGRSVPPAASASSAFQLVLELLCPFQVRVDLLPQGADLRTVLRDLRHDLGEDLQPPAVLTVGLIQNSPLLERAGLLD